MNPVKPPIRSLAGFWGRDGALSFPYVRAGYMLLHLALACVWASLPSLVWRRDFDQELRSFWPLA